MPRVKKEASAFYIPNPGVSWEWLVNLLIAALAPVVKVMSDTIRKELVAFLRDAYGKAKETANPWDDFIFSFFLRVLGENPDTV